MWFWLLEKEILKNMTTRKALGKLTLTSFWWLFKELFQPAEKTGHQHLNWDYLWVGELEVSFFPPVCQSAFFTTTKKMKVALETIFKDN